MTPMAPRKTCDNENITVEEAERLIADRARPASVEKAPLGAALGRVLREEIRADRDLPPFARVTMDGIALAFAGFERGTTAFKLQETQRAGAPATRLRDESSCIAVMTGGVVPEGCDCVVQVEETERFADYFALRPAARLKRGQNIHRQGSDRPSGALLVRSGTRLLPPHIAICASVGKSELAVSARPSVALVATGDELVDVGAQPLSHQIRSSNVPLMAAALETASRSSPFRLPDDPARMRASLEDIVRDFDVVVLSGGVSAGEFDFVPEVFEEIGVSCLLRKVRQRPGLPLWFGVSPEGKPVFGLPGNPVSTTVAVHRYVLPFLARSSLALPEEGERAALSEDVEFLPDLTLFLPVKLSSDQDGRLLAEPRPTNGSGDFAALASSDGFVELPRGSRRFPKGSAWRLWRWSGS